MQVPLGSHTCLPVAMLCPGLAWPGSSWDLHSPQVSVPTQAWNKLGPLLTGEVAGFREQRGSVEMRM